MTSPSRPALAGWRGPVFVAVCFLILLTTPFIGALVGTGRISFSP